jgi:hypothetical protein
MLRKSLKERQRDFKKVYHLNTGWGRGKGKNVFKKVRKDKEIIAK